ncbi:hypothetical protein [Eleftheria terrae]|uniref:hypothetical protein n=1 Tax=Eleftheria terrae TaxID=1597781 RepID=UPI00263AB326|nr:hypothetical protein [Eleftheria terrae]WKB54456.1 hypothetical protein N7L95_08765 [Eleftheria terrae]
MEPLDPLQWLERAQSRYRRRRPCQPAPEAAEVAAELWQERRGRDTPEDAVDDHLLADDSLLDSSRD